MLRLVIDLDAPESAVQSVKEGIAMYLERFGDARCREVRPLPQGTQLGMNEWGALEREYGINRIR